MRFIGVFLTVLLLQCTRLSDYDRQQVARALKDSLTNRTESWDFTVQMSQNGIRTFQITAAYGYSLETDTGSVTFARGGVDIKAFDSSGVNVARYVSCQSLTYAARTSFLSMYGDVKVRTSDEKRLFARDLLWIQPKNLLLSDGFVTVITPDDSISGYGLRARDDLSTYRIKEVSGEVTVQRNTESN
jgi:hypothetical protein